MSAPQPVMEVHPALRGLAPNGQNKLAVARWLSGDYWIDANHILHSGGDELLYKPITTEAWTQPKIVPTTAIFHTFGGPGKTAINDLWKYINRPDVVLDVHLILGGVDDELPYRAPMIQALPFNVRSDCSYKANPFALTVESQDRGHATLNTTPWSLTQLNSLVGVAFLWCICYGVWCTVPATWDDSGIAQHNLFPQWSVEAHSCPGAARTRQMDHIRARVSEKVAEWSQITGWKCGTKP